MILNEALTFDDVLLSPKFSDIKSRSEVDTTIKIKNFTFSHPIIPANMKSVIGERMAEKVLESGGLAILHRFDPIEEQIKIVRNLNHNNLAVSIGVKSSDYQNVNKFLHENVKIICIDIAHGDSQQCIDMIHYIKEQSINDILIIAGNVATGSGAMHLWKAGADIVKVGIGSGSICTTRIEAAAGVPQITALDSVFQSKQMLTQYYKSIGVQRELAFISDGGVRNPGDCVKACCFADMVMVGGMFAGCKEAPGDLIIAPDGTMYKEHNGSSTHKADRIEGVKALTPVKGSYDSILKRIIEGIQSGCSYQGCRNLNELKHDPHFIRITNAGLIESNAHDVIVKK